jgi:tRNA (guanine-N7-)-methyltransferase
MVNSTLSHIKKIYPIIKRYANDKKIEIEIGCGNGHFITDYSIQHKNRVLIGIDLKKKRCFKALKKIKNKGLNHIYILTGRAENLIGDLPFHSISKFHIYFPDPWPKNRHKKRRFFKMMQLENMKRALIPAGRIYFVTDCYDYYLQAKILLALHPAFKFSQADFPAELYQSMFSQRMIRDNKKIYFISSIKQYC